MDFRESPELLEMRKAIREMSRAFPPEYWMQKEVNREFPIEFWKMLADGGWLGIVIPEEYGGSGLGAQEMAAVIEETVATGAGNTGGLLYVLSSVFGALSVLKHGSDAQKRKYLPGLADGSLEFALAWTEPDAGSNALQMRSFARRDGDGWLLNGSKVFITNVQRCHAVLIACRTTPFDQAAKKTDGITLFLLDNPAQVPGVQIHDLPKMGINALHTNTLFFEDVRLTPEMVLGEVGKGWRHVLDVLNAERIAITAIAVGLGQLALSAAVKYAGERQVFGQPIGAHQALSHPLAAAKAELECARLLNQKAAWLYDQGLSCGAEVNMAKFVATEACWKAADAAVQVHGGYGYIRDYHVERYLREARLLRIAPITSEMAQNYIAEHVLGLPRSY